MKCANCSADALYLHSITKKTKIAFCGRHLPRFLEPLRKAGNLLTTDAYASETKKNMEALRTAPAPVEIKVEEPVVEAVVEPVIDEISAEEPVVEEPVIKETPKPKKKSAPKSAEDETNS